MLRYLAREQAKRIAEFAKKPGWMTEYVCGFRASGFDAGEVFGCPASRKLRRVDSDCTTSYCQASMKGGIGVLEIHHRLLAVLLYLLRTVLSFVKSYLLPEL